MSDEALLIGSTVAEAESAAAAQQSPEALLAQGRTAIAVPQEDKNVSIFAIFKGSSAVSTEEYIEKRVTVRVPKQVSNEDIAQFVWQRDILRAGVFITTGSAGEVNLYPLELFKSFRVTVGVVVGVSV